MVTGTKQNPYLLCLTINSVLQQACRVLWSMPSLATFSLECITASLTFFVHFVAVAYNSFEMSKRTKPHVIIFELEERKRESHLHISLWQTSEVFMAVLGTAVTRYALLISCCNRSERSSLARVFTVYYVTGRTGGHIYVWTTSLHVCTATSKSNLCQRSCVNSRKHELIKPLPKVLCKFQKRRERKRERERERYRHRKTVLQHTVMWYIRTASRGRNCLLACSTLFFLSAQPSYWKTWESLYDGHTQKHVCGIL